MSNQILFIGLSLFLLLYCVFRVKKTCVQIMLAFIISVLWVTLSGLYTYTDGMYTLFGINLFTVICWTAGLTLFKEIYDNTNWKPYWYVLFWFVGVLVLEYIGYHLMGIQLSSNYAGVFGSDILHVPWWAQIWYLTAGPLFIIICEVLKIK